MELRVKCKQGRFGGRLKETERARARQAEPVIGRLLIVDRVVPFFQNAMHVMQTRYTVHVLVITDECTGSNQEK